MESNFAALTLPSATTNPDENQATNNNNNDNSDILIISRKISQTPSRNEYFNEPAIFKDNFNLKLSRLMKNSRGQEITDILEIVFPIFRNLRTTSVVMNHVKSLEDSHEPMEIEEISYTDSTDIVKPCIKIEKDVTDMKSCDDSRPKTILRESKLTNIFDGSKVAEPEPPVDNDLNNDMIETCTTSESISDIEKMKSKLRPLVKKDSNETKGREKSTCFFFWQMMFFILFPIAIIVASVSIARTEFDSYDCAHSFNATETMRDLEIRIFGQPAAIRDLNFHLGSNFSRFKVLALIGGTGVGKSYAAHIISENFPARKNIFQYVPPLNKRRRHAVGAVSVCGCNLIIIENLHNKDIPAAADFLEELAKVVNNENYCVFVINVINIQRTDNKLKHDVNFAKSTTDIENIYRNKNLDIKIVPFQPLDDETVVKCIIYEAKKRNLKLSETEIDDVRLSLRIADSGCKGASAKVQLLDTKFDSI